MPSLEDSTKSEVNLNIIWNIEIRKMDLSFKPFSRLALAIPIITLNLNFLIPDPCISKHLDESLYLETFSAFLGKLTT